MSDLNLLKTREISGTIGNFKVTNLEVESPLGNWFNMVEVFVQHLAANSVYTFPDGSSAVIKHILKNRHN